MDANTLASSVTAAPPVPRPGVSLRRLWQAPVFVLGVAACLGFWFGQPLITNGPARCEKHILDDAQAALDRGNGDPEEIARRLQNLVDRGVSEALAGKAHFLYGTALMRVAETVNGERAPDYWARALEQLEEAEKCGVAEGDQPKLQYRLAKVGFYLQSDPEKVIERLNASLAAADDRAEGYNLLTAAYLRLTPPNLQAALEANEQLRMRLIPSDEVLAQAQLTGGEILLRMRRAKEARELLERIGNQAPAPILTKARILRARSKQDENDWAGAEPLWRDAHDALPDDGLISYNLGLCHRKLDLPTAEPIWEQCVRKNGGDESAAAAVGLAELHVQHGQGDKALERLDFALHNVQKPDDWDNKLLDRAAVCDILERCCQTARQADKFELALQLADWYKRLAAPAQALVMSGDIAADWARARREAVKTVPPASKLAEETAARGLFKQAADAYEQAAKETTAMPDHGDYLWKAVMCYIDADEQASAMTLLDKKMFALKPRPDALLGKGWYLIGESFRNEIRPNVPNLDAKREAAENAYKTCVGYVTPYAYEAWYQLAQFDIERGDIDNAVKVLEDDILRNLPGEESDVKQRARFALVHLCYGAKKYKTVIQKMEEVREHLPETPEAIQARVELANSYRLLADEEANRLEAGMTYSGQETITHHREQCRKSREHARDEFLALRSLIEKPETANPLDAKTERDVYSCAAYVLFQLGDYEKSLSAYRDMAKHYDETQPGHWTAIAGMVSVYTGMGNEEQVRRGRESIRTGLAEGRMDAETKKEMTEYLEGVDAWLQQRAKRASESRKPK